MKDSFKELTFEELLLKRHELNKQYFDISFDFVLGHVDNVMLKRNLRRKIARLNYLIYNHKDVSVKE